MDAGRIRYCWRFQWWPRPKIKDSVRHKLALDAESLDAEELTKNYISGGFFGYIGYLNTAPVLRIPPGVARQSSLCAKSARSCQLPWRHSFGESLPKLSTKSFSFFLIYNHPGPLSSTSWCCASRWARASSMKMCERKTHSVHLAPYHYTRFLVAVSLCGAESGLPGLLLWHTLVWATLALVALSTAHCVMALSRHIRSGAVYSRPLHRPALRGAVAACLVFSTWHILVSRLPVHQPHGLLSFALLAGGALWHTTLAIIRWLTEVLHLQFFALHNFAALGGFSLRGTILGYIWWPFAVSLQWSWLQHSATLGCRPAPLGWLGYYDVLCFSYLW